MSWTIKEGKNKKNGSKINMQTKNSNVDEVALRVKPDQFEIGTSPKQHEVIVPSIGEKHEVEVEQDPSDAVNDRVKSQTAVKDGEASTGGAKEEKKEEEA